MLNVKRLNSESTLGSFARLFITFIVVIKKGQKIRPLGVSSILNSRQFLSLHTIFHFRDSQTFFFFFINEGLKLKTHPVIYQIIFCSFLVQKRFYITFVVLVYSSMRWKCLWKSQANMHKGKIFYTLAINITITDILLLESSMDLLSPENFLLYSAFDIWFNTISGLTF